MNNPIIFIGTGRCGSTYISGAIFSHKDIAFPSNYTEKMPSFKGINLIRYLFDNNFWRVTTRGGKDNLFSKLIFLPSEAYSMWRSILNNEIDFSRGFLLETRASENLISSVNEYFDSMVTLQGKSELGFKITGPGRIGFLLSLFPNARFIWVKRNLIPTVRSFMKVNFWKSRGYNKLWFTGGYSQDELKISEQIKNHPELITVFQLKKIEEITEYEFEKYNPKRMVINYEEFLLSPFDYIDRILEFLDLPPDEDCYNYIKQNPVRERTDNGDWVPKDIWSEFINIINRNTMYPGNAILR